MRANKIRFPEVTFQKIRFSPSLAPFGLALPSPLTLERLLQIAVSLLTISSLFIFSLKLKLNVTCADRSFFN
jgi:hypothetical protein